MRLQKMPMPGCLPHILDVWHLTGERRVVENPRKCGLLVSSLMATGRIAG